MNRPKEACVNEADEGDFIKRKISRSTEKLTLVNMHFRAILDMPTFLDMYLQKC